MQEPQISVVIPVWNGADQIPLCLDAIAAQTLPRDQFEVLVVDNGSTDTTLEVLARYPFVRVLQESAPGSYNARNTALPHCRARYIALTDADCIPASDWLERILAAFQDQPDAGIIAGKVDLFRVSEADSKTCEAYERLFVLNQEAYAKAGSCATANWASPLGLLRSLGGFNGALKSGGDFEMASRIVAAGRSLLYRDDVVVRHPIRGQIKDILRKRARVFGGEWARTKPPVVRHGLTQALHGAKAIKFVLLRRDVPATMKLRLAGLLTLITANNLAEHARLSLGGSPRRS